MYSFIYFILATYFKLYFSIYIYVVSSERVDDSLSSVSPCLKHPLVLWGILLPLPLSRP